MITTGKKQVIEYYKQIMAVNFKTYKRIKFLEKYNLSN